MVFIGIRLRLPIPVSDEVAGYVFVGVAVVMVAAGVWWLIEKLRKPAGANQSSLKASGSAAPLARGASTPENYALETEAITVMAVIVTRKEWVDFCNQFPDLVNSELRKRVELFIPRAHIRLQASLAIRQVLSRNPKLEAAIISKALLDAPGMDQYQQYQMINALVQIWPHLDPHRKLAQ